MWPLTQEAERRRALRRRVVIAWGRGGLNVGGASAARSQSATGRRSSSTTRTPCAETFAAHPRRLPLRPVRTSLRRGVQPEPPPLAPPPERGREAPRQHARATSTAALRAGFTPATSSSPGTQPRARGRSPTSRGPASTSTSTPLDDLREACRRSRRPATSVSACTSTRLLPESRVGLREHELAAALAFAQGVRPSHRCASRLLRHARQWTITRFQRAAARLAELARDARTSPA